jgi:CubicO group peptidase (beta-lactamase class C family)
LAMHSLRKCLYLAVLPILLPVLASRLVAQAISSPRLADYVGTYVDAPGHTLEIADGDGLFAVVDEAKYLLHSTGVDRFSTTTGQVITFPRDTNGKVTGWEQNGKFNPRVSATITPEAAELAQPRPKGQDQPADYRYHEPANLRDGIAVADIANSDLGVATANSIVRAVLDGTYKDVHSVLLFYRGKLVMEEYFYGYNAQRPHQLRSATKSVVSTLTGIAMDRGAIPGVKERVLPAMRYATYANPDPRKAAMTLDNFLSMSSGLDCNDHTSTSPGRETVIDDTPDWVKATLDLPMINDPGTKAYYCSGGVSVVGRLIENAVHVPLPEFAQANLFGPLGMAPSGLKWNYNLTNADKEYSQIYLRPRDMLKLGVLFLNEGRWHGRQILSESWVHTSLAEHSHVDGDSYGYFWWRHLFHVNTPHGVQEITIPAAQGNGGQKIYIAPQFHLVAVFTGGGYNGGSTPPNTIMEKIILPPLIIGASQTQAPQK